MKIYRIEYGHDNGCNGQAVSFAPGMREAKEELIEAKGRHDPTFDHIVPKIQTIEFNGPITRKVLCELLNIETSPLSE